MGQVTQGAREEFVQLSIEDAIGHELSLLGDLSAARWERRWGKECFIRVS